MLRSTGSHNHGHHMNNTRSNRVPQAMKSKYQQISDISDQFCSNYLNEEYAELIRFAIAALCRKRPSPLGQGRPNTWACGITHAIGMVNFLFDKSQSPHISASELFKAYGVSKSSGQSKSKAVRDSLNMFQMDPNWTLSSLQDQNPMTWMISVNGYIVDARTMPEEIQVAAYKKGLIPRITSNEQIAHESLAEI